MFDNVCEMLSQSTMLEYALDRRDPLSTSYPNDNIINDEYHFGSNVKGTFSALNDRIAVLMDPSKKDEYVNLFDWEEEEVKYIFHYCAGEDRPFINFQILHFAKWEDLL